MKAAVPRIAFRYCCQNTAAGITRSTTQYLAETLGVDEAQMIHLALRELAAKVLPQHEPDEGPLTPAQLRQMKESAPKAKGGAIRSSLFGPEGA